MIWQRKNSIYLLISRVDWKAYNSYQLISFQLLRFLITKIDDIISLDIKLIELLLRRYFLSIILDYSRRKNFKEEDLDLLSYI